jgi:DNA replication and repair protein RecF
LGKKAEMDEDQAAEEQACEPEPGDGADNEKTATDAHRKRLDLALSSRREEDLRRGFTSVGPHQDDLELRLGGRSARLTASQGETRTLVLALKLAEVELVRERRSEVPVLLLDDLGSELDQGRREELLGQVLGQGGQTFLSTVVPESLPDIKNHVYFKIDKGKMTPTAFSGFPRRQGS